MGALDEWFDVCRTGNWRDNSGKEVKVDEAMLDGLVSGYPAQDPAPVVVGHPATDAPAFARVDAIRRVGDRLQAKIRDVAAPFRDAVEAGYYSGRSIAIAGGRLRHLGFLGGRPPAVPGLSPTRFAAAPETVLAFASGSDMALGDGWSARDAMRSIALTIARIARGMRERIIATNDIETADEAIPSWDIEHLQRLAEELREDDGALYATPPEETAVNGIVTDPAPDAASLAARKADLDAREARLRAREGASAADAALEAHVRAGRILPAERAGLAALLASLPGDETTIAFAAPEGGGEVREKPREVLERFLAALPARVDYRERAGGEPPPKPPGASGGEDHEAIAAEARVLMSEAADRGVTLSAEAAVDQVRAKRGLAKGGAA